MNSLDSVMFVSAIPLIATVLLIVSLILRLSSRRRINLELRGFGIELKFTSRQDATIQENSENEGR